MTDADRHNEDRQHWEDSYDYAPEGAADQDLASMATEDLSPAPSEVPLGRDGGAHVRPRSGFF